MGQIKTGILGLGAVSTFYYLKKLNESYSKKSGVSSTFPCLLINTDFNKINSSLPNQFNKLEEALVPYLNYFEANDISRVLIPNITIHETIDKILENSGFRFSIMHPLRLMVAKLLCHSVKEIYLLGTMYTMESSYVAGYFAKSGITCLPVSNEIKRLIDTLRREVYAGRIVDSEETEKHLLNFFGKEKKIVLACTELSVLFSSFRILPFYDMAEEQISSVINPRE
jgi:aspartate racemase